MTEVLAPMSFYAFLICTVLMLLRCVSKLQMAQKIALLQSRSVFLCVSLLLVDVVSGENVRCSVQSGLQGYFCNLQKSEFMWSCPVVFSVFIVLMHGMHVFLLILYGTSSYQFLFSSLFVCSCDGGGSRSGDGC